MNKKHNKIVNDYIKEINQVLVCSKNMKKALINEIKQQILELENKIQVLTIDDLHNEIGTPEEIAQGFECREDIQKIKKKATKYRNTKIICWICAILAVIAITTTIIVIYENDDYHYGITNGDI